MECKGIRERLSAYLEGVVTPEEKRFVEQHLSSCEQCSRALKDLKKTEELVLQIPSQRLTGADHPPQPVPALSDFRNRQERPQH